MWANSYSSDGSQNEDNLSPCADKIDQSTAAKQATSSHKDGVIDDEQALFGSPVIMNKKAKKLTYSLEHLDSKENSSVPKKLFKSTGGAKSNFV